MAEILRTREVIALTKMPRSTIYDQIKDGTFPAPFKIGRQAVAWTSDQIEEWIKERMAASVAKRAAKQGGDK
jgi:prophage regulatory protein